MGMYESDSGVNRGTYGVIRNVTERKKAESTIRYQAYHELLTGLPNRTLFRNRLGLANSQARRSCQRLAVMFLDLDRFKIVNDTFGRGLGDELLKGVANRLQQCLREGDTIARLGGDELIVLIPQVGDSAGVAQTASKITRELRRVFTLDGQEIFTSGSLGVALFPDDGESMDDLIKNADIAMYHMKEKGRDGYEFFEPDMNVKIANYLSMESDMRKALQENEFTLLYQPQINLREVGLVGFEALLRWRHSERGLLMPSGFIPHAEESGLIVPIGKCIVSQVCKDIEYWQVSGKVPTKLAINLSALQFDQQEIVDEIIQTFDGNAENVSLLEIEITENFIMKDIDSVVDKLTRLSRHGVSVAVDDFVTGYSSLSYLHKLPIDTIKIDRSFVSDIDAGEQNNSLVDAIVSMANGLGLNIIAEVVESRAQAEYLLAHECEIMRGFLFSKPLTVDEIGKFQPSSVMVTH